MTYPRMEQEDPEYTPGVKGDWVTAGFVDVCSFTTPFGPAHMFTDGDVIRADGIGGWECQECVHEDEQKAYQEMETVREYIEENRDPYGYWETEQY